MSSYTIHVESDCIVHKGNKNSGRYRRGSGERPHQHDGVNIILSPKATKKISKLKNLRKIENSLITTSLIGASGAMGIATSPAAPFTAPAISALGSVASLHLRDLNTNRLREKGYEIIRKDYGLKKTLYNDIALRNTIADPLKIKGVKNRKEESEFWKGYAKEVQKGGRKHVKKKQK